MKNKYLGSDSKYHSQGSFVGVNGHYVESGDFAETEKRSQKGVDA